MLQFFHGSKAQQDCDQRKLCGQDVSSGSSEKRPLRHGPCKSSTGDDKQRNGNPCKNATAGAQAGPSGIARLKMHVTEPPRPETHGEKRHDDKGRQIGSRQL